MAIHTLSMFSGAGMLDVGIGLAYGPIFDTIAYVECEAYAVSGLAAAMEQGRIASELSERTVQWLTDR